MALRNAEAIVNLAHHITTQRGNNMTHSSPFDLRNEALGKATDILTQEYFAKAEQLREIWKHAPENLQTEYKKLVFPTPKTIMDLAHVYDEFISGKARI